MDFTRILKNVLPAIVVLAVGLFGVNFIYNTYMKDGASTVITLEPAAGEDSASGFEDTTGAVEDAADQMAAPATDAMATDAMAPDASAADCMAADDAAKAAEGTDGADAAAKAAADCHAAASVAKAAEDISTDAAVDAAQETEPAVPAPTETMPTP